MGNPRLMGRPRTVGPARTPWRPMGPSRIIERMHRIWLAVAVAAVAVPVAAAPAVELEAAKVLLAPKARSSCADIPCLIEAAYASDEKAKAIALALYRDTGNVA